VLEGPLRLLSIVLSAVVLLGWVLFAVDTTGEASRQTAAEVAGRQASSRPDPSPDQERSREAAHGSVRELVDDVNDVLLSPFADVGAGSESRWVRRTVPAVLALLVYGLGLGFLARFSQGRA
jgi:hypothetical protein